MTTIYRSGPRGRTRFTLAIPRELPFLEIPGEGFAISKAYADKEHPRPFYEGKFLFDGPLFSPTADWYEVKLLVQKGCPGCSLPTLHDLVEAREYVRKNKGNEALGQFQGEFSRYPRVFEHTDSLLAFPDCEERYSPRLPIAENMRGQVPLLITNPVVKRYSGRYLHTPYVITGGEVMEVPFLPTRHGYVQEWHSTGLPLRVGDEPNPEIGDVFYWVSPALRTGGKPDFRELYSHHEGLICAEVSCEPISNEPAHEFNINVMSSPCTSLDMIHFRLVRRVNKDDRGGLG